VVSAGLADITFPLVPKNQWPLGAGVALAESAGGFTSPLDGTPLRCNNRDPLLKGLIASGPFLAEGLLSRFEQIGHTYKPTDSVNWIIKIVNTELLYKSLWLKPSEAMFGADSSYHRKAYGLIA
jgi:hypothetical protein